MKIYETPPTDEVLKRLAEMSVIWESEDSCYGYRANAPEHLKDNRIFVAEESGEIIGYLFGKLSKASRMSSILEDGADYFEIDELYVLPEYRSRGIGRKLFDLAEKAQPESARAILLSTATKNYRAILHFYIDEVGMNFWNARLFKYI